MFLKDTVLLAADTARTNAYAQALCARGIVLEFGILFGDKDANKPGQLHNVPSSDWSNSPIFLPDPSIPVSTSVDQACDNLITVEAGHVNDPAIVQKLEELSPELVVYSGYGSQIVGERLLDSKVPFLHIHSGWLPDFRGSTTIYYHLLETGECGASAIFLEKEVDTGSIIARKCYPRPPAGLDIDYVYDCAIRADLLVDVLEHYASKSAFPELITQSSDEGNIFYIIHPVLKHIAILSCIDNYKRHKAPNF